MRAISTILFFAGMLFVLAVALLTGCEGPGTVFEPIPVIVAVHTDAGVVVVPLPKDGSESLPLDGGSAVTDSGTDHKHCDCGAHGGRYDTRLHCRPVHWWKQLEDRDER